MGYLKVICEAPGIQKTVENLLCLSIGSGVAPDSMWWDYNVDDGEFICMGITANQANKLLNYIYEKSPEYMRHRLRFRLVGYSDNNFEKPKDNWEALNYMLQAFPKRRNIKNGT